MSTSQEIRSALYIGPSTAVDGVGNTLVIPDTITGGKPIERLISVGIISLVTGTPDTFSYTEVSTIFNGAKSTNYTGFVGPGAEVLLDGAVRNRLVFSVGITTSDLVWIQYQTEGNLEAAVTV